MTALPPLALFTDLDGCLLNKHDYDFAPALPVLERLQRLEIPVILSSSKTEAEMRPLSVELGLDGCPLVCENGGIVIWNQRTERQILGVPCERILELLHTLRDRFEFRSFDDLGVDGVMEATDLPREKAAAACDRVCTQPLQYLDQPDRVAELQSEIESHNLTLTRGGRFWHVAGKTTKGVGMQWLLDSHRETKPKSIAIGDSPIDQSMLDIADYPIGIPHPDGSCHVHIGESGRLAQASGSEGWREAVSALLCELGFPE